MHQEQILNPFGVSESSFCIVLSYVITMHMKTLKFLGALSQPLLNDSLTSAAFQRGFCRTLPLIL